MMNNSHKANLALNLRQYKSHAYCEEEREVMYEAGAYNTFGISAAPCD